MKLIDKFLKFLKTDRNTFATYILTLFSIYFVIDRFVEILLMIFTGVAVSYWSPIKYALVIACVCFAFYFAYPSKFVKNDTIKHSYFYMFCIFLYIIGASMFVQFSNQLLWLLLVSVPNFVEIATEFSDLIKPAFQSIAAYFPVLTFYPLFKWLYTSINDSKDLTDSIEDYGGIDLSPKSEELGEYTSEIVFCKDKKTGKSIKIPEKSRFESTLIVGVSGTGKTSMVFEPMIAQDIEKKSFYREVSKEHGYIALKTGIATLNCPYDNDYINNNFSLNMITPVPYKLKLYKSYVKKLTYHFSDNNIIYKNIGLTYLAPDYESINHIIDIAKNYNIKTNIIDPNTTTSVGLNPFIYDNPVKTAIIISSVLKGMHLNSNNLEEAYRENSALQALENLAILLKTMYPRLNEGSLPNLEDLLKLLNNFDLVEEMCEQLKSDEELREEYSLQIGYFEKNFYKNCHKRIDTEKYVYSVITQLDNLLRYPGIKQILCNRTNNLNFEKALKNGEITLLCTRRGDLGSTAHKAFGLFFLLLTQHSILSRPGNEKTRIPHYLYIDEFGDFICKAIEPIFTLYRKYRVGNIISSQNLAQLEGDSQKTDFKYLITANCANKMVFGNNSPDENEWWEKELGEKREWKFSNDYKTDTGKYDSNYKNIEWAYKKNFKAGKVQSLKFKNCIYKVKNLAGKQIVEAGKVDFVAAKYKEKQKIKTFNFTKFSTGIHDEKINKTNKISNFFKPDVLHDTLEEADNDFPIITNISDSKYLFDNEDAVSIPFNPKKKNNN